MMGNQWVSGLHLVFLCMFLVATEYTCLDAQNSTTICHERERQALLEFKHSVKHVCGVLSSWVGTDCCSWKGVRCDGATRSVVGLHLRSSDGDAMEYYYYYEEECYLVGDKVSAYLGELRHLKHLDLSGNNFQGSQIAEFIGSLKQLSYLNLSRAGFIGIIPHHIGNLSNLNVLDLGSNYGLIANDMAWVSSLSSLHHLDLSYVNLSQAKNIDKVFHIIPSLTYLSLSDCELSNVGLGLHLNSSKILPNIQHLDLGFNHFEGQLPHFLHNMTSLTFLDLSRYNLSMEWNSLKLLNTLPTLLELRLSDCGLGNTHFSLTYGLGNTHFSLTYLNFSALPNIQYLDLSWNSIGGQFPSALINITSLRVLLLSSNNLNSSIPVMPNLLKLDVFDNNFESIEVVGIWRQCHLKELSLSVDYSGKEMIISSSNTSECSRYALEMLHSELYNFNGLIPESLGRLTNLRVLQFKGVILTNSVSESFGRLINLRVLQLEGISFTGSIPESLGRLTNLGRLRSLEVLDLSNNHLNGSIPTTLGRLRSLEVLDLSNNHLNGSIPTTLGRLRSLEVLDLSNNLLNGSIPESFGRLKSLTRLNLESNQLTGQIPVSIGQLSKLGYLDLSENSLEGVVFEAHFANLSMLKNLQISDNYKLIFNISPEWTPPFQLRIINFGSCNLANGFPKWLQTQRNLGALGLSNASLQGLLPTFFRKMPKLYYLDLSYNKLSGSLINLLISEDIVVLLLQDNLFNGSLPTSLCKGTSLRVVDVSSNQLYGSIPKCIKNLHDLKFLILSSNRLSRALPSSLGIMSSSLVWLKLNDNNFNGKLPHNLGNFRSLKVLDLGNNEFSGSIPIWIGENFTDLVVLRLHKNNFTGGIPQSLCRCSQLQILDIAHNNLLGSIPRCFGGLRGMIEETYLSFSDGGLGYDVSFDKGVIQVMKGIQLDYTTNLNLVINMDLSSNKLTGEIPPEVTALVLLLGLNLSHNQLSGRIPDSIGNMKALISLDFSDNQLTGIIPPSMADLNFLSVMNLSYNNLSGRIPTGNQLQTLNDPSIYAGNSDLCGDPLPNNCSNHENPSTTLSKSKYEPKKVWFYLDITCGFATGFWGVIGVLSFKKQWRRKLFMVAEVTLDKVFVMVAVRVSKIKRGKEGI